MIRRSIALVSLFVSKSTDCDRLLTDRQLTRSIRCELRPIPTRWRSRMFSCACWTLPTRKHRAATSASAWTERLPQ